MRSRWLLAVLPLISSGSAPAQPVSVTNFIRISFQHSAWGEPGDVWAGLLPGDPDGVGSVNVTTTAGDKGTWNIESMTFLGAGNQTWLTISIADGANNLIQLYDGNASLMTNGRTGTFTQITGTGAFHTATVNIGYTFTCIDPHPGQCYTGGAPVATDFLSSFSADGTITATITNQPVPPPNPVILGPKSTGSNKGGASGQYSVYMTPGGNTVIVSADGGNGNVVLKHSDQAPAAGSNGSISLTVPSQFVAVNYTAAATCTNVAEVCWATIPSPSGALPAFTTGTITADLNFGNPPPGVYPADLSVALTAPDGSIPPSTENSTATLIINPSPPLLLSESGVTFQTGAGALSQLVHSISLSSSSPLAYTATASTLSGGNWLSVAPASGTTPASGAASVGILANPSGLAAGTYFGRVDINAPGASTVWQSVEVELTVVAPGIAPPIFSATGLIFSAAEGAFPPAQDILVSTLSNQQMTISPGVDDNDLAWFKVDSSATTLQSGQSIKQTVLVGNSSLTPGVYPGSILEAVGSTNDSIPVVLIVTPSTGTCTPSQLVAVVTSLYGGFELPAGLPVLIQAQISDDCGSPLTSGTVIASAGPGDAPVMMTAGSNGQWSGTWLPHGTIPGPVSVEINAQSASGLQGCASVTGTIDANTTLPVVTPGGIVSAANPVSGAPLAPGEFISIYGANLAPSTVSSGPPYPTTLGGTQVLLGGVPLPLQVVSPGLINAVVPFETQANAIQELLISQNGAYSLPESVVVASVSPAIFTQSETGEGPGVIVVYKSNGTVYETSPTQPASAGDLLLIYASGLGAVSPAVADGAPGPTSPPFATTVNPVSATIGGVPGNVSFAGLAPGYVGVYQVNVTVPSGVTPGTNVPVVLATAGFSSATATVTIQ